MTETAVATSAAHLPEVQNQHGSLAIINDMAHFNQMYRVAKIFAASSVVPKTFVNSEPNCFIAVEMANRMGINPIALMQNMAVVNGKPSLEAKLITALINDSGMFADDLAYEIVGTDPAWNNGKPADPTYKVRAHAVSKRTGEHLSGPWISWEMVMGEGWVQKEGSKWKTMPELMFLYRAASFFSKIYCTNITMGMQTREEMEDVTPYSASAPRAGRAANVVAQIAAQAAAADDPATCPTCDTILRANGTCPECFPEVA